jgi:Mu-like prophage major head subunit gpT
MTPSTGKIIRILDADRGKFAVEESVGAHGGAPKTQLDESFVPYPRDQRGRITVDPENMALTEAMTTSTFPDLLRQGLQFDAWTSYNETPATYPAFARVVESSKQQEEYLLDSPAGLLPIVHEGEPYPEAQVTLEGGKIIRNDKRGMIMSVTVEMQKFDQVGKVRELGDLMGRAARLGEEQDVMTAITDTSNYTRASTAGDNDETTGNGANTQNLTFSPTNLIVAFNILRTMKDRKTGVYLNVMPNTLIVTPKLWWAAQQLIQSPESMRVGGTNEVYGTGTTNSFFNVISTIIVSPQFGNGYQWALLEAGRGVVFQRVEPVQVLLEGENAASKGYFERDLLRYRVRNWYGAGIKDDRFITYFPSNTSPAIG